MRILAISHLFPTVDDPRYGIFVARQLAGMAALGADITVVVPRTWCPDVLRRFERWKDYDHHATLVAFDGLTTVRVPFVRPPGNWFNRWAGLSAFRAMASEVDALHARAPFDLIYASDFFPDGDAAVRMGRRLGIPATCLGIGVDVNDTARSSPAMFRHFTRVARALDGTLACGDSVADHIREVSGKESLCVYGVLDLDEFIPAGSNEAARAALQLPREGVILLYAGYLHRRKGVYELIEAVARVREHVPDVYLALCGGGGEAAGLGALVRERGIEERVRFAGEVAPELMPTWMQAADLFVLPSYTEGVPNVVLEAMASGLPVVATAVGGTPAAVGHSDGVILVPPRDVDELASAIAAVAGNPERRQRMGVASRAKAEAEFGVTRNARRILDYLDGIVAAKGGAR